MTLHTTSHRVSFGDCDPAGIVFYPNFFRWMDATFHDWLDASGGHAALCAELGAIGIGLMQADARFRAPLRPGEVLDLHIAALEWGGRALRLEYAGQAGDRRVVEGTETRAVFLPGPRAGAMEPLRRRLGL